MLFAATAAYAVVASPFVLGSTVAASGSTSSIQIQINKDCPGTGMIWVVQAEVGGVQPMPTNPTDDNNNVYTSNNTGFSDGAILKAVGWTTNGNNNTSRGLKAGKNITLTYFGTGPQKLGLAVCVGGVAYSAAEGVMGAGNQSPTPAGSSGPNIAPTPENRFGNIIFVVTLVGGGRDDQWTESCGYTTLASVADPSSMTDKGILRVAYTIVGDQTAGVPNMPLPYCAMNSVS